jgi:hypothetical protein
MKYDGKRLNVLQEDRVVEDFFDQSFIVASEAELESWITHRQEDTEYNFLMYNEEDIDNYIKSLESRLKEARKLKNRDFSTEKFKDSFYFEK